MSNTGFEKTLLELEQRDEFIQRHIGPGDADCTAMLSHLGLSSLEELVEQTVPASIRLKDALALESAIPEHEALLRLRAMAQKNQIKKSMIGLGYYDTIMPPVIQRTVLENPGWYTAYTPYQAEIAQGRLEALLNFQTMVTDLTGMQLANASLLDEATAAAEAMTMARRISKSESNAFFVDAGVFPQTIDVVRTRAGFFGFDVVIGEPSMAVEGAYFGVLLQTPNAQGELVDHSGLIGALTARGTVVSVATDLMACVLSKPAGEMGADIVFGSSQRFGIPMGFGGPHAAFFATHEAYVRSMPGRIIGVSKDSRGRTAMRMTLQTREQHIRREKANSNICTSQVLLANLAGMYAVYHGPRGLAAIAGRIARLTGILAAGIARNASAGIRVSNTAYFDTLTLDVGKRAPELIAQAASAGYNLARRPEAGHIGISVDEKTTREDIAALLQILTGKSVSVADIQALDADRPCGIPSALRRTSPYLQHPVFNFHHSEHEMLRYLKKLQNKDLALDHSMISLGSCTMKLNAASEMLPIGWAEFANVHPFAPIDQVQGYLEMVESLASYLRAVTGFEAINMQPNSGAQGEYAGLVAISRYHASRGEAHRKVCLIPKSAHGTNPATAQLCNMEVVVVNCDDGGNVDLDDLRAKAELHAPRLACLMLTYPSTHGVFEEAVREICDLIHRCGGQVYMDGANLNAQVGLTSPALIGADVSHMNLHKTFAIPHGGGGPGMGPIGMRTHLAPFMAGHVFAPEGTSSVGSMGAVSAAPFGSASILPISWMYITMMGSQGLAQASKVAILNANYVANRLNAAYPVLYRGQRGRVAHECILDVRAIKTATGISEIDIAKRLMDYGFHAPTVSFPVAGTLMVEPTESESKAELDRFCEAMLSIREEIRAIERGEYNADDSPLKHAPHTQQDIVGDGTGQTWSRPYTQAQAVFPLPWVAENKFWPSVNRIDDVYGDRNLFCSCVPTEEIQHG